MVMKKLLFSLCIFNISILFGADTMSASFYHTAIIKDDILECAELSIRLNLNDIDPIEIQTYKELMDEHTPLLISGYKIKDTSVNKYAYACSFLEWQKHNATLTDPLTNQPIDEQTQFSIETIHDKVYIRNLGNNPTDQQSLLYQLICYQQEDLEKIATCKQIARIHTQEQDMPRVIQWLEKATHICEPNNSNELGKLHRSLYLSYQILKNQDKATAHLIKSAEYGNVTALTKLGHNCAHNDDLDSAIMYLTRASKAGNKVAMGELGNVYAKKQDLLSAALWFEQASACGHAQATVNRGMLCEQSQDFEQAFTWYEKAAQLGCVTLDLFYVLCKLPNMPINLNQYQAYVQQLRQNSTYTSKYKATFPQRYARACQQTQQICLQPFDETDIIKKRKRDLSDPS